MTLIISAHGADCLVVGADSRGTTKYRGNRVASNIMDKIFPIGTHAAVLISGETELATNLVDILGGMMPKRRGTCRQIAAILSKIAQNEARESKDVPAHPDYFPSIGFIVGGLDSTSGRRGAPSSFTLKSESAYRLGKAQHFAMDGLPMIARYIFSRDYKPNMPLEDLQYLVVGSLVETMSVDGDVGGKIRIGKITVKEGWRYALPQEVDEIERKWKGAHPHAMQ